VLGRYQMVRGKRSPDDPLPEGVRQDTRKHQKHILRPDADRVAAYLADPGDAQWDEFATAYRETIESRLVADAGPFEELAELARQQDVWLGCSCPTPKNPDVRRCHTYLALQFMAEHFEDLDIVWPD
jgi:uncharacterized protein YeaO (DUF488 family)